MHGPDAAACRAARRRLIDDCMRFKSRLNGLQDDQQPLAEQIHATRKLTKSLRGGLAMFRLQSSAALEIQAIGRLLSGQRDAVSRLTTWDRHGWHHDPTVATMIRELLVSQTQLAAVRPPASAVAWCHARVDLALAELVALDDDALCARVAAGWMHLRNKAANRCAKLKLGHDSGFHDARKALKAWFGAITTVTAEPSPDHLKGLDLMEWLGDENDLATLTQWLDAHGLTRKFVPDLWRSLTKERKSLQRRIVRLAHAVSFS